MIVAALAAQLLLAQSPTESALLRPLEEALARISFGPTASAGAIADSTGVAPTVAIGFQVAGFDVEKIPEPRCAEHHRHERE
ncbi:MAG: hypothetical protein ACJ790_13145, partial [Myxococcaceae bacterium]